MLGVTTGDYQREFTAGQYSPIRTGVRYGPDIFKGTRGMEARGTCLL